ncbi:uncharacterized protein LOC124110973 [Haliotis rufescens]|uniref:uncharacterized protein LOC124110973 n=1 Tax=Haliotis rufescens TaxID=6454 RepID=UPI001EB07BE4|nr:uncharacterized protein LOC124110973 [Haliotis rufescens]
MGKEAILGFIFAAVAVGCMVLAFASPYWVESFDKFQGRFTKIGLWEVCFNDYTFYKDYKGKRYLGCWYIFSQEVRPIWEWLSPPWFISVQVMVSFTLLIQGLNAIALVLFLFKFFPKTLDYLILMSTAAINLFAFGLILIALIVFGVKKEDRSWVPRPDMNFLSWSYGLCCISGLACVVSAYLLHKASKKLDKELGY